jgi:hypothetical protein
MTLKKCRHCHTRLYWGKLAGGYRLFEYVTGREHICCGP